jgi:hypothetical protein
MAAIDTQSLTAFLAANRGVVFAQPAIVHRKVKQNIFSKLTAQSYCGRSLIAPNSAFVEGVMDSRGYVPVEW